MTVPAMNDLLLDELWDALKSRLDTATMRAICNPPNTAPSVSCVYVAGYDDFSAAEGDEAEDWGRVVVVPVETLWDVTDVEGQTRKIGFLLRSEFNNLKARGYRPATGLHLSQREGYRRLQRWTPTGFDNLLVAFGMYRQRAPQPIPQRDDTRGLLWLSSEFRLEVSGVSA